MNKQFAIACSGGVALIAAAGAAAAPCVDQLVSSTQNAEPQDPCAAPAAARSATLPEHAIANRLFIPLPSEIFQSRAGPLGT